MQAHGVDALFVMNPANLAYLTVDGRPCALGLRDVSVRLARQEERDVHAEFGEAYARYAAVTPAFVPRLRRSVQRRRA